MSTDAPVRSRRATPFGFPGHFALAAAGVLVVNGAVGLIAPDTVGDHSTGAGLVSELTAGAAFLLAAISLVLLTPAVGTGRSERAGKALWLLAPAGLAVAGLTMVGVVLTGSEPGEWLFVAAVLPTFIGLVAAGVIGSRRGVWPWWTGVGVAVFLPVMFLVPFNSFVMAGIWLAVALTVARPAAIRR
jgi:hypothetical protein